MYYCFNPDCNMWGEPQGTYGGAGLLLVDYIGWYVSRCNECGHITVVHDNFTKDTRTHDDGTPVKEPEVKTVTLPLDRYKDLMTKLREGYTERLYWQRMTGVREPIR